MALDVRMVLTGQPIHVDVATVARVGDVRRQVAVAVTMPLPRVQLSSSGKPVSDWMPVVKGVVNHKLGVWLLPEHQDIEKNAVHALGMSKFKDLESRRSLKFSGEGTVPTPDLYSLPESFGKLTKLRHLSLFYTRLLVLPQSFGELAALQSLNVSYSELGGLPPRFGQLVALRSLTINHCRLRNLPASFGDLLSLEHLDLTDNRLEELPDCFCRLRSLQTLSLMTNRLLVLPSDFGQLRALRGLNVSNNSLTQIPDSICAI
eukprot:TRINITY_DN66252_c0_g1_i1.p1 TRINITY_DN66252_c0_g1~~TRINITY_DN66252_c0_g1_i1.p1  ORF type:complete len:261 (+),score=14.45 TRINITY_DN66252_c0_g1_i1:170-952(+)